MAKKKASRPTGSSKKAARKSSASEPSGPSTRRGSDEKTAKRLTALADKVVKTAGRLAEPEIEIPTRTLSNVQFNTKSRLIEMGDATTNRNLFNYGHAKRFMQTMLVASKCNELLKAGKTASIRQIYYMAKHTIKGTNEKTFDDQPESDVILEDLEVSIDALREELHVFAMGRGAMIGQIILEDAGDTIDCSRLGTGGYAVPSIVEPDIIRFKKCDAKFVLHVEKDTVWRRFVEDKFWREHDCIVTHGQGQPSRGMRRLLYRLNDELKLPIYVLLDNDPWGYYIYSVIKQGSINLAYESRRMAVPTARFIGVSSFDYERCELADDVKLTLDDNDIRRAKQIMAYPWFAGKRGWEKEIRKMISNGFKMEVEAMINKSLTYLTEEYVPMKLADPKQWLD